jgi:hypothetical protein
MAKINDGADVFCVNCRWVDRNGWICRAPVAPRNLVNGEQDTHCYELRSIVFLNSPSGCGPEGKWFTVRP